MYFVYKMMDQKKMWIKEDVFMLAIKQLCLATNWHFIDQLTDQLSNRLIINKLILKKLE